MKTITIISQPRSFLDDFVAYLGAKKNSFSHAVNHVVLTPQPCCELLHLDPLIFHADVLLICLPAPLTSLILERLKLLHLTPDIIACLPISNYSSLQSSFVPTKEFQCHFQLTYPGLICVVYLPYIFGYKHDPIIAEIIHLVFDSKAVLLPRQPRYLDAIYVLNVLPLLYSLATDFSPGVFYLNHPESHLTLEYYFVISKFSVCSCSSISALPCNYSSLRFASKLFQFSTISRALFTLCNVEPLSVDSPSIKSSLRMLFQRVMALVTSFIIS